MDAFSWTCPYCQHIATITEEQQLIEQYDFNENNKDGHLRLVNTIIICPNPKCKEYTIRANLFKRQVKSGRVSQSKSDHILLQDWLLKPQSIAKPFPDYIPTVIRKDYIEACLICDLSPKASATLSRRCLQGIIRDYWGVSKNRLIDEINALQEEVDSITWQAIDAVRKIGNIGAHMEKDIDVIIDVEPQEAKLLISLIEILLKDWYIARHERQQHLQAIIAAADSKEIAKKF